MRWHDLGDARARRGAPATTRKDAKMASTLRRIINAGVRIVHAHGNGLFPPMLYGPYLVSPPSPILEVTFVRNDLCKPVQCRTAKQNRLDDAVGSVEQLQMRLPE